MSVKVCTAIITVYTQAEGQKDQDKIRKDIASSKRTWLTH